VAAAEVARAQLELLRIRAARAELMAQIDVASGDFNHLKRLAALDRYERLAATSGDGPVRSSRASSWHHRPAGWIIFLSERTQFAWPATTQAVLPERSQFARPRDGMVLEQSGRSTLKNMRAHPRHRRRWGLLRHPKNLRASPAKVNLKQWLLIAYFLGQIKLEEVSAASNHGAMGRGRECNLSLFAGEEALAKGNREQARQQILRAREVCNVHTLQYLVAGTELGRMKD
jgi:hypothetical protein